MGLTSWLVELPIVVSMLLQIAVWVVLALVACWVGSRMLRSPAREGGSDSLIQLLSVVTGFYAFLVGFLIVQEWSNVNAVRASLSQEAAALSTAVYNASLFPAPDFARVRTAVLTYNRSILCDELPRLARNEGPALETTIALQRVYAAVGGLPVETRAMPSFGQLLGAVDTAAGERRRHLNASTTELPAMLLILIVLAAVGLVVVAAVQATGHQRVHTVSVVALAIFVGFAIGLVVALSRPYAGAATISDAPLRLGVPPEKLRCT